MAFYVSKCPICGKTYEYRAKIEHREVTPFCCNRPTQRQLSAPMGYVDKPAA